MANSDVQTSRKRAPASISKRAARSKSKLKDKPVARSINSASKPRLVPQKKREPLAQKSIAEGSIEKSTVSCQETPSPVSIVSSATTMPHEPDDRNVEEKVPEQPRKNLSLKRRIAPLKSPVKTNLLALGGAIPREPIVISAEQIRIEHCLRQQAATVLRGSSPPPNTIPLTVESLTQRWIKPPQSSPKSLSL